jgi:hypothetical protein
MKEVRMWTTYRQRFAMQPSTVKLALLLATVAAGVVVVLATATLWPSLTTPNQVTTLQRWADATQKGDFATAETLMHVDPLIQELWLEQTRSYQYQGRMGMYHLVAQHWTGNSLSATLYWHTELPTQPQSGQGMTMSNDPKAPAGDGMAAGASSTQPLCMQVQVGPDGKVVPLTPYHACTAAEMQ